MTDELIAFLRACLDEEEQVARGAALPQASRQSRAFRIWGDQADSLRDRRIAEVSAQRRITATCEGMLQDGDRSLATYARDIVEALLTPYAGHPDFRAEWPAQPPQ